MSDLRSQYERDGYCLCPGVIPLDLVERVIPHMDAVIDGQFETGVQPHMYHFKPEDGPHKIRKVDQPHLSDNVIHEVISHPNLGKWAAHVSGAKRIQVFAVQLLVKPPGGQVSGNVGWHQDKYYWPFFQGDPFTAWIAISDVTAESGPMRFVRGSHQWGFLAGASDFFDTDQEGRKKAFDLPQGTTWEETSAILPPGGASFHNCLTIHGSGPNISQGPRRSFAVHLVTDRCTPIYSDDGRDYYARKLVDHRESPVIYEE